MKQDDLPEDMQAAFQRARAAGKGVREPLVRTKVQAALEEAGLPLPGTKRRYPRKRPEKAAPYAEVVMFLDLDGCAHSATQGDFFVWLEPLLDLLAEHPDVAVVIHSSWRRRYETDTELRAQLPAALARRVIAATPRREYSRQDSIEEYIRMNKPLAWVVVDDEPGLFKPGFELVVCDPERGFSDSAVVQQLRLALLKAKERAAKG